MSTNRTLGPFSVVNGKLFRATATARIEVPAGEAAHLMNDLLTALRAMVDMHDSGIVSLGTVNLARTAIARAAEV